MWKIIQSHDFYLGTKNVYFLLFICSHKASKYKFLVLYSPERALQDGQNDTKYAILHNAVLYNNLKNTG